LRIFIVTNDDESAKFTSESDTDGDAREEEVQLVAPSASVLLLLVDSVEDVDGVRSFHLIKQSYDLKFPK
jgi:hypothetical protein